MFCIYLETKSFILYYLCKHFLSKKQHSLQFVYLLYYLNNIFTLAVSLFSVSIDTAKLMAIFSRIPMIIIRGNENSLKKKEYICNAFFSLGRNHM